MVDLVIEGACRLQLELRPLHADPLDVASRWFTGLLREYPAGLAGYVFGLAE